MTEHRFSDSVVIATGTRYDFSIPSDIVRAELAKKTVAKAVAIGYKMMIVDEGSPKELLEEFKRSGAIIKSLEKSSMGRSRRLAIGEAYNSGREIIVWMEPEKASFVDYIVKSIEPLVKEEADMVIPKRTSLKSYPLAQQYAEPFGNLFFKQLTGKDLDVWFGPRIFRKDIAHYFLDYEGEYGDLWEAIFVPILDAVIAEEKVIGIDVDYIHPQEQKYIEEHDLRFYRKRLDQLDNIVNALEMHWRKKHA